VPSAFPEYFDFDAMSLPVTTRASQVESVWMGESIFRSGQKGVDDLVDAIQKLVENRDGLKKLAHNKNRTV
jgi:hypothetical protein